MLKLRTAVAIAMAAGGTVQAGEIARGAVAQGGRVFVTSADGTLAALDTASGALRWSTTEPMRPLAVEGARVLAQATAPKGRLRLVLLDAGSGRPVAESTVALPADASAPLDDTEDTRFAIEVERDGPRVRLEWRWEYRPMRGAYLEEAGEELDGDDDADRPRRAQGALRVDLSSAAAVPEEPKRGTGPETLPAAVARQADAGAFRERPRTVGSLLVATTGDADGPVLKRWSPDGRALADVALPAAATLQLGSAEGGHLLLSREVPEMPLETGHEWTVIALDTGARVATLRTSTAAAGFAVAANHVLVAHEAWEHRTSAGWRREPRRLVAFDRASGALAWSREIRDGRYLGPVAP